MRSVFILVFVLSYGIGQAQTPVHRPMPVVTDSLVSGEVLLGPGYEFMYTEERQPFFRWDILPLDFEFTLFNRWGEVLGTTTDPSFIIDKILKDPKALEFGTVYVGKLSFTGKGGVKHTMFPQYKYMGFYNCG